MHQILELEEKLALIMQQILKAEGSQGLIVSHLHHICGDSHAVVRGVGIIAVSEVDYVVQRGWRLGGCGHGDGDGSRSTGGDLVKPDIDQVAGFADVARSQIDFINNNCPIGNLIGQLIRNHNLRCSAGTWVGHSNDVVE